MRYLNGTHVPKSRLRSFDVGVRDRICQLATHGLNSWTCPGNTPDRNMWPLRRCRPADGHEKFSYSSLRGYAKLEGRVPRLHTSILDHSVFGRETTTQWSAATPSSLSSLSPSLPHFFLPSLSSNNSLL